MGLMAEATMAAVRRTSVRSGTFAVLAVAAKPWMTTSARGATVFVPASVQAPVAAALTRAGTSMAVFTSFLAVSFRATSRGTPIARTLQATPGKTMCWSSRAVSLLAACGRSRPA